MVNLKKEIKKYCNQITLNSGSEYHLLKAAYASSYPMLFNNTKISFNRKDEVLFTMYYQYLKGHSYDSTLNIADSIVYENNDLTDLYKSSAYLTYKALKNICYTASNHYVPEYNKEVIFNNSWGVLSKIQYIFYILIKSTIKENEKIDELIELIKEANKQNYSELESGFSFNNALHNNLTNCNAPYSLLNISNLLKKLLSDTNFLKKIISSNCITKFLIENAKQLLELNLAFKAYLYNVYEFDFFKWFFCDFQLLVSSFYNNLENVEFRNEKINFFVEVLKCKSMVEESIKVEDFIGNESNIDEKSLEFAYWSKFLKRVNKF